MSHLKGFFKKITGDPIFYDALAKQPIIDAELKLNLFKDVTTLSVNGIENYLKYMSKTVDMQLGEKFLECKELFKKYENKGETLNPSINHVMGIVFGKLSDLQQGMHTEIIELTQNIEQSVLKPLNDYQREVSMVKENRKELKEAYDKIEQYRQSLDKAKRDVDNAQRSTTQSSRLTMMGTNDINKKMNEVTRLEEKVQRIEKELDEATSVANEKYDKYTEALYKRIADECDLTNCYLEYLKLQRKYHKQVLKRLESLIPGVKESLVNYNKKPVFGCSLGEYVNIHNNLNNNNAQYQQQQLLQLQNQQQPQQQPQQQHMQLHSRSMMNVNNVNSSQDGQQYVSPVIRKLIEGMCKQNVFVEEGIFRVAGSRIKMNCLLYAINAGYLEYLDFANDFDVHCLAGVLKQYIRELPDSILCNGLYDYWINAINTSPPNKLDAFRNVLNRLPKTNYENLKYLIKFLSRIVENSEKTKMTTTNMGICFGVSLISSNNQSNGHHQLSSASSTHMAVNQLSSPSSLMLNNHYPHHHHGNNNNNENVIMSTKLIDMATATNVFDFLLTNHGELFPGDVNFGSNSLAQRNASFYHRHTNVTAAPAEPVPNNPDITNYKHSPSNQHLTNTNTSLNTTPNLSDHHNSHHNSGGGGGGAASHRHSVMLNDSLNTSLNESQSSSAATSQLQNSSYSKFSTAASPSSSLNINHINRHVKNNSIDIRYLDVSENNSPSPTALGLNNTITASNNNNNNQNKASNVVVGAAFPSISTQINASSTVSLDTGSGSPKLKAKKQAPAPPRQNQNDAQTGTQNSSLSTSLIESTHSLSSNSSIHNISASNNSTSATKPLNISNEGLSTASTASSSTNNNNNNSSSGNPNNLITKLTIEAKNPEQTNGKTADVDSASSSVSSTSSLSVPTLPVRSVSLKQHDLGNLSSSQANPNTNTNNSPLIEKPNQPPPQVPSNQSVRQPPPIGFNISILGSGEDSPPLIEHKTPPYPTSGDLTFPLSPPDVHKQHSPDNSNNNKSDLDSSGVRSTGPKPAVPRRPGNVVSAHLSKFQRLVDQDTHETTTIDPPEQQSKSLSEITSL